MKQIYFGTHSFARELLSKSDDYLTVTFGDKEYAIKGYKKVRKVANSDDSAVHTTIICDDKEIL